MSDGLETPPNRKRLSQESPAVSLASKALEVLARNRNAGPESMSDRQISELRNAVTDPSPSTVQTVLRRMRADGIEPERIVDVFIPVVARILGDEWCADQTSFAEVTIGSARLQGALREILNEMPKTTKRGTTPSVMVLVRDDEHHTLGASVMTSQLRRLGVSVRLVLGATSREALTIAQREAFDAIFISVSNTQTLEDVGIFVEKLRSGVSEAPPIVVGGPILEQEQDTRTITGADVVTSDVREALRKCRLNVPLAMSSNDR